MAKLFTKFIDEDTTYAIDWEKRLTNYGEAGYTDSLATSVFSIVSPASPSLSITNQTISGYKTIVRVDGGDDNTTYMIKNVVTLNTSGDTRVAYFSVRSISPE